MEPLKLYFDIRDIFRAPRLALSGKKIFLFLIANIFGFAVYFLFSYLSLIINDLSFVNTFTLFRLYPHLFAVKNPSLISQIIYWIGVIVWLITIFFACTAVSRVTYKQLKGNELFSVGDAKKFLGKHRISIIMGWLTIFIIAALFAIVASIFALIGKLPFIGEIFFAIFYLLFIAGAIFTIYTLIVLVVAFLYTPSIVATMEEDTIGTVFQSYSITWSQLWRILVYNLVLIPLMILCMAIFKWFIFTSYAMINILFGANFLMGQKLQKIMHWATNVVLPNSWLSKSEPLSQLFSNITNQGITLSTTENIAGIIIAIFLLILILIILSYGLSILSVGETIILTIIKFKSNAENILLRIDEDDEQKREMASELK